MNPGPITIYKCPNCHNLLYRGSLMSGNTFGAQSFSDGKKIAPMLPTFPNITKCSKCNSIFWIHKAKEVGTCSWESEMQAHKKWKNAENVTFLALEDYFLALKTLSQMSKEEEIYIRKKIWWSFNDRIRIGQFTMNLEQFGENAKQFISDLEERLWTDNVNRLLELLDDKITNHKIMIAELSRNLGRFDKCMEILNTIEAPELNWLICEFEKECRVKNNKVFLLK